MFFYLYTKYYLYLLKSVSRLNEIIQVIYKIKSRVDEQVLLLILHESVLQDIRPLTEYNIHIYMDLPDTAYKTVTYMTVIYKTVTYIINYPRQLTTRPTIQDGFFLSCSFTPHVSHTLTPIFTRHHVFLHVQFRIWLQETAIYHKHSISSVDLA